MRAIILAAGVGCRLGDGERQRAKCLLRFDGRSLIERHLHALARAGVERVSVGVGHRADDVRAELAAAKPPPHVDTVHNPHYREGNVVTLHTLAAALDSGDEVLVMDADVLYHEDVLLRLVHSRHGNCLLFDREFEAGDEPVKLCLDRGRAVAFGKQVPPGLHYDLCGESVGFFKFTPPMARRLARQVAAYVERGERDAFYEDAIRDLLLENPQDFGVEDVTGVPWIEIDFPEDIERAERTVMARIHERSAA